MRLGQKYQIGHLLESSLSYLRKYFPTTLDEWKDRTYCDMPGRWRREEAIGVVNLARLTGTEAILPTAMVVCCQLDVKDLIHGFTLEDGSREKLSDEDVVRCMAAKHTLSRLASGITELAFLALDSGGCGVTRCQVSAREIRREFLLKLVSECQTTSTPAEFLGTHPFEALDAGPWSV